MKLFDKTWKLALSGVVIGLLVMLLAMSGNPANMAICVACFIRDAAGALKLHTAAPVQYFRPEIVGFVCGSFLISMATKEYRSTAGSAPMVRFLLGAVMMIGALVFLGCPLRMVLRMSAGDAVSRTQSLLPDDVVCGAHRLCWRCRHWLLLLEKRLFSGKSL